MKDFKSKFIEDVNGKFFNIEHVSSFQFAGGYYWFKLINGDEYKLNISEKLLYVLCYLGVKND